MTDTPLYGLVLAGGESQRMGFDKSKICYHAIPQREYIATVLSACCEAVFISCRNNEKIPGYQVIPDAFPSKGPLIGLLSAFQKFPRSAWITVPVDMPELDENILLCLVRNRHPQRVATCFCYPEKGSTEPLPSLWEPTAYSLLLDFYQKGKRSLRDFLKQHPVQRIPTPHPNALININTPDEWRAYVNKTKATDNT